MSETMPNNHDAPSDTGWEDLGEGNGDRHLPDYAEPEMEELKVALINQDEERETRARFHGENNLSKDIERSRGIGKFFLKFWKNGIAKNFYRQRSINQARREIQNQQKLFLDASDEEYREYRQSLCRTYLSEADDAINKEQGDERESLKETNPELHGQIKDLIERYASRDIDNREDLRVSFDKIMQQVKEGKLNGEGHLAISNIEEVAIKARNNFENLATVAEAVNSEFDHNEGMARVMKGFDVLYGKRNTDRVDPHYNRVDKVVDKIAQHKIGCLVSKETIALAAGAVAGVASFAGKRTLRSACVVPGLGAAIWGAAESAVAFEDDRARAQTDKRYSREYDTNEKMRKKTEATLYTFHSSNEVADDLRAKIDALAKQKESGAVPPSRVQDLLNLTARTQWYLRQERTKNPVLTYSSEIKAPAEQLQLIETLASAKHMLRDLGINDVNDQLSTQSDLMQSVDSNLHEDIEEANRRAKKAKILSSAKKFGTGLATGVAVGLVAQEVSALFNPNVQGIFEDGSRDNPGATLTAGCKLAKRIGVKHDSAFTAHFNLDAGTVADQAGQDVQFVKADDGTYSMVRGGKNIASGLEWNDQTGELTESSVAKLSAQGVKVSENGSVLFEREASLGDLDFTKAEDGTFTMVHDGKDIASSLDWNGDTGELTDESLKKLAAQGITVSKNGVVTIHQTVSVPGTSTDFIPANDLSRFTGTNDVVRAHRAFWWDNDTPKPDFNELGAHSYTDPNTGLHGFVTKMTDTGSVHNGSAATFSKLAKDNKIKLFISLTKESQSTPIEVTGKLLDNGQIAFVPEPGSAAAACFDESGNFIGKFAEIAQVIEENGADITYAPLATDVGSGLSGVVPVLTQTVENITRDVDIPQYSLSFTEQLSAPQYDFQTVMSDHFDIPIILPFTGRKSMGSSKMRHLEGDTATGYNRGYGYSYTYGGSRPAWRSTREEWEAAYGSYVSPRIKDGKELKLGEELEWYVDQMKGIKGADYMNKALTCVEGSADLNALDNKVKTIVTIPVHGPSESENIYHTLSVYARQEGVDFDSMPIVLNVNWRATEKYSPEELRDRIRQTYDEIARARADFPHLKIATFEQVGHSGIHDVSDFTNNVVMTAIDKAIDEGRMSSDHDVLIIRNDADVRHMNKNYISSYQKAMVDNPKTPLFTGTTFFNIDRTHQAPGFGSVLTIDRMENLLGAVEGTSIHTAGANFAFRASHFAATSGSEFAPDQEWLSSGTAGYDDLKVGYNIETALAPFYWQRTRKSGRAEDHDLMDPDTRMLVRVGGASIDTDDVRYLTPYAADTSNVLDDAYNGSFSLRPDAAAVANFQEQIMDKQQFNTLVEQFEREMSDRFSQSRGDHYRLERVLRWWFGGSTDGLYTIEGEDYASGHLHPRQFSHYFVLTDTGKQRLRESILERMGDGISTEDRNTLQRAITDGEWL